MSSTSSCSILSSADPISGRCPNTGPADPRGLKFKSLPAAGQFPRATRAHSCLTILAAGALVLRFESIGYVSRTDAIAVKEAQTLRLKVRLSRSPIELPPISVSVESTRLAEVGYYDAG